MKKFIKIFTMYMLVSSFTVQPVLSQDTALHVLQLKTFSVHYSDGHDARARSIAVKVENAILFNKKLLGFVPVIRLLVLSETDWKTHTTFPVYGMPHYKDDKTLIVASSDNDFWRSFIPPAEQLPAEVAGEISKIYTTDGKLTMQAFFDLLALHELGHAYHIQGGLTIQRKWMGELFCNLLLHTYVAENERDQLAVLTLFPRMVVNKGSGGFVYTTLDDLDQNYEVIGARYPANYGWFQCRLHVAAGNIYDEGGKQVLAKLWSALKLNSALLPEKDFINLLQSEVHGSVAKVAIEW